MRMQGGRRQKRRDRGRKKWEQECGRVSKRKRGRERERERGKERERESERENG